METLTRNQLLDLSEWAMKTPFMAKHYSPRLNDRERQVLLLRYGWDYCSNRECKKCWELIPTSTWNTWTQFMTGNETSFFKIPTAEERRAMHQDMEVESGLIDPTGQYVQPVPVTGTVSRSISTFPDEDFYYHPVTVEDILHQDTHQKTRKPKPHTQKEIGVELGGITGGRVGQIEAKAIRKNRYHLRQLWKQFTTMVEAADVAE